MRCGSFSPDPADSNPRPEDDLARRKLDPDRQALHGVWDEPALSAEISGQRPADAITYGAWLDQGRARTGPLQSWGAVLVLALLAGPWAVLGAFYGSGRTAFSIVAIVVVAPVVEETMKIALASVTLEKRPFLFTSPVQILICGLAGGLVFGIVENLLYLNVYISDPGSGIVAWRWSVCTALHAGCSLIASIGLVRIWKSILTTRKPAKFALGFRYLLTAVIIHGVYNGLAVIFSYRGF